MTAPSASSLGTSPVSGRHIESHLLLNDLPVKQKFIIDVLGKARKAVPVAIVLTK